MIKKYPDKTSYAQVDFVIRPEGEGILPPIGGWEAHDARFHDRVFRINTYEDLWHLKQYVDAVNNLGNRPLITIPNLLDAQADRRFNENESFGLKLVIEELARMNADFRIFHPHNPEVVEMGFELLGNPVDIISNSEFIEDVFREIKPDDTFEIEYDTILMSADAGGFKPLVKLADTLNWEGEIYSASKGRKYDNGETKLTQIVDRQDFNGKNIIIIDDLCIFGGTFKGLSKLLRERNVGKLYLAVSHMTMQELGQDPVTNYFDGVFTTNSKYDEYYYSLKDGQINQGRTLKNLTTLKYF